MRKLLIPFMLLSLTGCSVYMAGKKEGTDPQTIINCATRTCLVTNGAISVSKPTKYEETFKIKAPTGSTSRAVLHGTMDVLTVGLWEVAGTPIEGSMDKDNYYNIKVKYKQDGETIESVAGLK